jgi:hypothetical protein
VVIEGTGLPGPGWPPGAAGKHRNLHIALCTKSKERPALVVPGKPWLATEPVPGDAPSARWEAPVTVRRETGGFDFSGPYAAATAPAGTCSSPGVTFTKMAPCS